MPTPSLTDRALLALSRAWFAVDVGVGRARGSECPNCGNEPTPSDRAYDGRYALFSVWSCPSCGLLYRPVGLSAERVLSAYYTYVYANADLATRMDVAHDAETISASMKTEGKDRVALVQRYLGKHDPAATTICIFGCSWGYELLPFRERGYRVAGIELGARRREHGRRELGLDLHASAEDAAQSGVRPDVLLSSHVLEHIPKLSACLDSMRAVLKPPMQIHVTPHIDAYETDPSLRSIIGREHPLGVHSAYWTKYAAAAGVDSECIIEGYVAGENCGDLVAVLRRR
jgi:hypothetical protein